MVDAPSNAKLLKAAREGRVVQVESLLAAGLDPNVLSEDGLTALDVSIFESHAEVVRALLAAGARFDPRQYNSAVRILAGSMRGSGASEARSATSRSTSTVTVTVPIRNAQAHEEILTMLEEWAAHQE